MVFEAGSWNQGRFLAPVQELVTSGWSWDTMFCLGMDWHILPRPGIPMVICIGRVCGVGGVGEISVSGSGTSMGDFDIGCF